MASNCCQCHYFTVHFVFLLPIFKTVPINYSQEAKDKIPLENVADRRRSQDAILDLLPFSILPCSRVAIRLGIPGHVLFWGVLHAHLGGFYILKKMAWILFLFYF
ncbi:Hypothetical predicted protein [Podarcis lilfordi]|uniref:Uncharacterized protein n=1 Tax=Podarcis lilfordi TaxID=74358 RepID=A0AA35JWE6_9SAUR|nr:Hypothetical predicted protein [Podarcis lilfordi]